MLYEVPPNTVIVLSLARRGAGGFPVVSRRPTFEFDLRQFKSSTLDWREAFRRAVRKRLRHVRGSGFFIGLSDGYDSGSLHLAVESDRGVPASESGSGAPRPAPGGSGHASVSTYSVVASELLELIEERWAKKQHNKTTTTAITSDTHIITTLYK